MQRIFKDFFENYYKQLKNNNLCTKDILKNFLGFVEMEYFFWRGIKF